MNTLIEYPEKIENQLRAVYPYRNEMRELLIANGYKVPHYFDMLVMKYGLVFEGRANNPNIEQGFFKDVWNIVKTPFDAVMGIVRSLGKGAENIINQALAGAADLAGGLIGNVEERFAPQQEEKKDYTKIIVISLVSLAAVFLLTFKKKK